mgnify:CR=1 FL=1
MKKKVSAKLLAALLATSTILSGCGAQETISMGTGSAEESVKDEKQDTVEITDIQWIMKDGAEFWHKYGSQSDEGFAIDEGMIVGKVVYSDGNEMEIEPENVTGTLMGYGNSCKINITYRDRMYELTSLNPWGDSEDPDALAAANSGRQVLIPSGSGSDGEVADVSGSVVLNPEVSEGASSTSQASASVEGTVDEEFSSYNAFLESNLYKKIEGLFAEITYDEDNEEWRDLANIYGQHPYVVWIDMPFYLECVGDLGSLHKLESVNTLDEFWVVYDEIMSPYGKDSASLKAFKDKNNEEDKLNEAREFADSWYRDKITYHVGASEEITDGKYAGVAYAIYATVVLSDDVPSLPNGYTAEGLGYPANGDTRLLVILPNDTSRGDWGFPEEGTIISYEDMLNWFETNAERYNAWVNTVD